MLLDSARPGFSSGLTAKPLDRGADDARPSSEGLVNPACAGCAFRLGLARGGADQLGPAFPRSPGIILETARRQHLKPPNCFSSFKEPKQILARANLCTTNSCAQVVHRQTHCELNVNKSNHAEFIIVLSTSSGDKFTSCVQPIRPV